MALPQFGHSPMFPISSNWHNQSAELLNYLRKHRKNESPIYLVGHSFGAVISYITACNAPNMVAGLILLDPPIVTGLPSKLIRLAKKTPLINKITPANMAETRKTSWSLTDDIESYFKNKALFKNFHLETVRDYVASGTQRQGNKFTLTFDASVEAAVFRNVPHNIDHYTGRLTCPSILVTGEQTDVCVPFLSKRFLKRNPMRHMETPGAHMFPMEYPEETAQLIVSVIQQWESDKHSGVKANPV